MAIKSDLNGDSNTVGRESPEKVTCVRAPITSITCTKLVRGGLVKSRDLDDVVAVPEVVGVPKRYATRNVTQSEGKTSLN